MKNLKCCATHDPRDERSLPDEVYLDILTFILRANKIPVGPMSLNLIRRP